MRKFFVILLITVSIYLVAEAQNKPTSYPQSSEGVNTPQNAILEPRELSQKETILALIDKYSKEYNVSAYTMREVVRCESNFRAEVQSYWKYDNGESELSFGASQIHLPSHPQVSKEQALDPDYAIRFMAQHFAEGNHHLWTCWRDLKRDGKI